jgi:hypothetical protein
MFEPDCSRDTKRHHDHQQATNKPHDGRNNNNQQQEKECTKDTDKSVESPWKFNKSMEISKIKLRSVPHLFFRFVVVKAVSSSSPRFIHCFFTSLRTHLAPRYPSPPLLPMALPADTAPPYRSRFGYQECSSSNYRYACSDVECEASSVSNSMAVMPEASVASMPVACDGFFAVHPVFRVYCSKRV